MLTKALIAKMVAKPGKEEEVCSFLTKASEF